MYTPYFIILALIILLFVLLGLFNNKYHKKEIKVLKQQIEQKEEEFKEVMAEKERLQDSSEYYEAAAYKADAAVAQAKAKAEGLLAQAQANPSMFMMLAMTNSDDSSAQQGGDLGFFSPGQMVKPFNDFAFNNPIG